MSAGRDLAKDMLIDLEWSEQQKLKQENASFVTGYLFGKYGREHSATAIYNAADHIQELIP